MNTKDVKNKNGFTLIEVLVASTLFVIVGGAIVSLFIYGSNLWQMVIAQSELRSSAYTAMYYMTSELQNATYTSTSTPSPRLNIPVHPDNNSVTFYLPNKGNPTTVDGDGNSATNWDMGNSIRYSYMPISKQLNRMKGGAPKTICNNVSSVTFENNTIDHTLHADELRITLRVEKNTLTGIKSTTLTSIIKLRN